MRQHVRRARLRPHLVYLVRGIRRDDVHPSSPLGESGHPPFKVWMCGEKRAAVRIEVDEELWYAVYAEIGHESRTLRVELRGERGHLWQIRARVVKKEILRLVLLKAVVYCGGRLRAGEPGEGQSQH